MSNPSLTSKYKDEMDLIYRELVLSPHLLNPQPAIIGTEHENPLVLNRNDASGERGIWAQEEIYGYWNVDIVPGVYRIRFRFIKPVTGGGTMVLETGPVIHTREQPGEKTDMIAWEDVTLPGIRGKLIPHYKQGGRRIFPFWVELERVSE